MLNNWIKGINALIMVGWIFIRRNFVKSIMKYAVMILFISVFFYYYNMFVPKNFLYIIIALPICLIAINIIDKLFTNK